MHWAVWGDDKFCSAFNLSADTGSIMMASNSCGRTWNCRGPLDTVSLQAVAGLGPGREESSVARLWIRCRISRVDRVWSAQGDGFSAATCWNWQFSVDFSAVTDAWRNTHIQCHTSPTHNCMSQFTDIMLLNGYKLCHWVRVITISEDNNHKNTGH